MACFRLFGCIAVLVFSITSVKGYCENIGNGLNNSLPQKISALGADLVQFTMVPRENILPNLSYYVHENFRLQLVRYNLEDKILKKNFEDRIEFFFEKKEILNFPFITHCFTNDKYGIFFFQSTDDFNFLGICATQTLNNVDVLKKYLERMFDIFAAYEMEQLLIVNDVQAFYGCQFIDPSVPVFVNLNIVFVKDTDLYYKGGNSLIQDRASSKIHVISFLRFVDSYCKHFRSLLGYATTSDFGKLVESIIQFVEKNWPNQQNSSSLNSMMDLVSFKNLINPPPQPPKNHNSRSIQVSGLHPPLDDNSSKHQRSNHSSKPQKTSPQNRSPSPQQISTSNRPPSSQNTASSNLPRRSQEIQPSNSFPSSQRRRSLDKPPSPQQIQKLTESDSLSRSSKTRSQSLRHSSNSDQRSRKKSEKSFK